MTKHESEAWWANDPDVVPCPQCGCPVQRVKLTRLSQPSVSGTLAEGMRRHYEVCHPELGRSA